MAQFDSGVPRTLGKHLRDAGEETLALFTLPPGALPESTRTYEQLVCGTAGAAKYFARLVTAVITTSVVAKKKVVWTFQEEDELRLWRPMNVEQLQMQACDYLEQALATLKAYVTEEAHGALATACEELPEPKARRMPGVAAWFAALKRCTDFANTLVSAAGRRDIAAQVFEYLRDDAFQDRLNSSRDLFPFENGMYCPRTRTLRPREPEDYVSYCVPYPWDPTADASFMARFVSNLYKNDAGVRDAAAECALQTTIGYWATGEVMVKAFWTIIAPSHAGKTSLLMAIQNALCEFACTSVAVANLLEGDSFEHDLALALASPLKPRVIFFDETDSSKQVKQAVLNGLTSGNDVCTVRARRKGDGSSAPPQFMAKIVFAGNNNLLFPEGADGTVYRCRGIGLTRTFQAIEGGLGMPGVSPPDPVLIEHVEGATIQTRQGVARWIMEGASAFYDALEARGRAVFFPELTCPRFDANSFELQLNSSIYMRWLAEALTPTGLSTSRVSLESLVSRYAEDRKVKSLAAARDGIVAVLETCRPFVRRHTWVEYGTEVPGYLGMQFRHPGDADWRLPATRGLAMAAYREEVDQVAAAAAAVAAAVENIAGGGVGGVVAHHPHGLV